MKKVARKIPFTFQQLGKYEKGDNTVSAYKLLKICEIYKADIAEIVKETFIENHQKLINKVLDQAYMSNNGDVSTEQIKAIDDEHTKRQLHK